VAISLCRLSAADKSDTDPKHQLPRPDAKPADTRKPAKVFIPMGRPFVMAIIAFDG
jgi:hypothetical protein